MSLQGVLILDIVGCLLILWLMNLVRRGQLYVGYSVIFIAASLCTIVVISVPALLAFVTSLVGALFPVSAMTLLALSFILLVLIYILTQLTVFSERLATIVQELAIRNVPQSTSESQLATGPDGKPAS